ncbi:MAG: glycoside hydrolase family 3 N-terminal domain-containing protein, partial [Dehalococcoidia bacterium]
MTAERRPPLTRRTLLRAAAGTGAAAFLASCGGPVAPASTPPSGLRQPQLAPTATALPPTATATPYPTPTPTPDFDLMIGQMIMVGFAGTTAAAGSPVHTDVHSRSMGGTVLFARNATSRSQVGALTGALQLAATASGLPLLISTDQEGGQVQRLGPGNGFAALPSAAAMGSRGIEYARAAGEQCGEMLAAAGVNLNLAPVVDVNV